MSVFTATSRYPWRKGEYAGVGLFAVLTVLSVVFLFAHVLVPVLDIILAVAFAAITVLAVLLNVTPKRNSTLNANMNTDTWEVEWWAKKPLTSVWGRRLNRLDNRGNIDGTVMFQAMKVGIHDVFEFRLESGKYLYLPERLANTDGVRDFLLAWVEHRNGQFPAKDITTAQKFVGVLNRGTERAGAENDLPEEPETETQAETVEEPVELHAE